MFFNSMFFMLSKVISPYEKKNKNTDSLNKKRAAIWLAVKDYYFWGGWGGGQ
jgi:hypothetical protein